jgi:hypothetical protein
MFKQTLWGMIVANSVAAGYAMLKVDREGGMKSGCSVQVISNQISKIFGRLYLEIIEVILRFLRKVA